MTVENAGREDVVLNPTQREAARFFGLHTAWRENISLTAERTAGVTEAFLALSDQAITAGIVGGHRPESVEYNSAVQIGRLPGYDTSIDPFHYSVFLPRKRQLYTLQKETGALTNDERAYVPEPFVGFRGFDEIAMDIAKRNISRGSESSDNEGKTQYVFKNRHTMWLNSGLVVSLMPVGKDMGRLTKNQVTFLLGSYLDKEYYSEESPQFPNLVSTMSQALIEFDELERELARSKQITLQEAVRRVIAAYNQTASERLMGTLKIDAEESKYFLLTETGAISALDPKKSKRPLRRIFFGSKEIDTTTPGEIDPELYRALAFGVVDSLASWSRGKK